MPRGSSEKPLMAYITVTCSNLKIPSSVLNISFPYICFLAFHPAQYILNKTRTAISRTVLTLPFSIDVLLRQICSSCCAICSSFVGRWRTAVRLRNKVDEQDNTTDGHTFCNLHTVYLGIFSLQTHYKSSVSHQRLVTTNASAGTLYKIVATTRSCVMEVSTLIATPAMPTACPLYGLHAAFTFRTAQTGSLKQRGVSNFRRNLRYCLLTSQCTADPKLRRLNLRPF
jgi:hypothetical protein